MKLNGRAAAIVLAMVATLIIGMDFRVEASQYLGQVKWTWHKTMNESGTIPEKTETIVASLFSLGNSCYELVGSTTEPEIGGTAFGTGTAMLVGDNLTMTLTFSKIRSDGRQETGIFQGQVDKTNFNGSGWAIKKRFDPILGSSTYLLFTDKYMAGTLTVVGTPPPLGATATAAMQLLLMDDK